MPPVRRPPGKDVEPLRELAKAKAQAVQARKAGAEAEITGQLGPRAEDVPWG